MARVFDFAHAIMREPGRSVVRSLRSDPGAVVDFAGVHGKHAAYVTALRGAGLTVDICSGAQ